MPDELRVKRTADAGAAFQGLARAAREVAAYAERAGRIQREADEFAANMREAAGLLREGEALADDGAGAP